MSKSLHQKLAEIQQKLNCPKTLLNKFAGYHYRSAETILEAVKPLLGELTLVLSDEVCEIGGRVYIKTTATISDGESSISNTSFAREEETKKGLDSSQITGSTISYCRKYALNGLFLIDDTKDSDATNTHDKSGDSSASKTLAPAKSDTSNKSETSAKTEQSTKVDQPSSSSFRRKPKAEPVKQTEEDDDY